MKIITLAMILTLLFSAPVIAGEDCAELINKSCTSCHYKTRICQKLGQKSKRDWKITVKRMLRYGLDLDKKGKAQVIECLSGLEKGSKLVCN